MAKMDNLLAILWMLKSDQKITAKQISEKLEMNVRTVYRYMDTLSKSGVPIISESGHDGGYSLLNDFYEVPLLFDVEEQMSLIHAADFAEDAGYYGGEKLEVAIKRIKNHAKEGRLEKRSKQVDNLEIINNAYKSSSEDKHLENINLGIIEKYSIKILYRKNNTEQSKVRLVNPYRIIFWNSRWYIVGHCHLRKAIRCFRVDRIEKLELVKSSFEIPGDFSAKKYFMDNLLPTMRESADIVNFVVRGSRGTLDDLCKHWFLSHYLESREPNEAKFFLEREIIHQYVPNIILPYGKSVHIVEPISLKKEITTFLIELVNFHQSY